MWDEMDRKLKGHYFTQKEHKLNLSDSKATVIFVNIKNKKKL